jgi:hypothetical protein
MKQADLTYRTQGLFTTFTPHTADGQTAWNEMAAQTDGTGKVLVHQEENVVLQLRQAGYIVRKESEDRKHLDPEAIEALATALSGDPNLRWHADQTTQGSVI